MSHSSDKADQRKVESTNRMGAEPQPGPSRCPPSRQGYCGYCRVLYSNLDQHLSSLRHLDSVQSSSRGSSTASSASSKTKLTLLERFLQDVLKHHPHHYKDSRPSHADLPAVSSPLLPREELDELCVSDKDTRSLGTREQLPSSDNASNQPADQQDDGSSRHSREGVPEEAGEERHPAPIKEQKQEETTGYTLSTHAQTTTIFTQTPPPLHRKAHRKTDRRKKSNSSSSSPPHRVSGSGPLPPLEFGPSVCLDPTPPSRLKPTGPGAPPKLKPTGPGPPSEFQPWLSWQKMRRETFKEEAFSSDHHDPVDQTIEEVIQMCCYGVSSAPGQQGETESFHLSIPVSMETSSDDWDSPVQPSHTPVQVSQTQRDLTHLMDCQVELEDQVYSYQLDFALHNEQAEGRTKQDQGFWTLPIDEILPAPQHIPESFRGKTWAQVEQEDEHRVEQLVRQFRGEKFLCYFDSESLARYGRRSRKKEHSGMKEVGPHTDFLPLLDHVQEDTAHIRRRKRRGFRVASRCQVVKVSHGTQTIRLVVPAVCQPASEAPPTSLREANEDAAERTPKVQTWRSLPTSYSSIITPLQPRTSVVYLLSCPPGPTSTEMPADSATKRCRKKRRPLGVQRAKVKYKRFPVRFYEATSNRILKNPPKGLLWHRGSTPSSLPPPCVRQLFRSLSPDLNSDRLPEEGDAGSSRVKSQRPSDISNAHISLLSVLSKGPAQPDKQDSVRGRGRTSLVPLSPTQSRSERGRGARRNQTRPQTFKRRTRAQAAPPHPRREGLRRTGPIQPPPSQQGRGRRGRGLERTRR